MNDDDEICLCFHVTRRKLVNYLRVERLTRASQLSECGGAGSGCGWCRGYLERLFAASRQAPPRQWESRDSGTKEQEPREPEPSAQAYAEARANYIRSGHGTPPPSSKPQD